jgi:hypothetical protein
VISLGSQPNLLALDGFEQLRHRKGSILRWQDQERVRRKTLTPSVLAASAVSTSREAVQSGIGPFCTPNGQSLFGHSGLTEPGKISGLVQRTDLLHSQPSARICFQTSDARKKIPAL